MVIFSPGAWYCYILLMGFAPFTFSIEIALGKDLVFEGISFWYHLLYFLLKAYPY